MELSVGPAHTAIHSTHSNHVCSIVLLEHGRGVVADSHAQRDTGEDDGAADTQHDLSFDSSIVALLEPLLENVIKLISNLDQLTRKKG